MTDLLELAARVEAAEGPSIYLDAEIRDALGLSHDYSADWRGWGWGDDGRPIERAKAYPYTASLDAAMMLVPEGFGWAVTNVRGGEYESMDFSRATAVVQLEGQTGELYDPATPALALVAASLRARAAQ